MKALRKHTECKWELMYIERWLKAPVAMPDGSLVYPTKGTPQGGVVSPMLSNLFLHYCFDAWMARNHPSVGFERYADDAICHCASENEAKRLREALEHRFAECKLELHPEARVEISARFGGETTPLRLQMGEFPVGSAIIPNPVNRIPGFSLREHHFVPGFPQMAWPMVEWALDTHYRALFDRDRWGEGSVIVNVASMAAHMLPAEMIPTHQFPQALDDEEAFMATMLTACDIAPEDAGVARATMDKLKGGDAAHNADAIRQVLAGRRDAFRDIVVLNSAAALMVAGKAGNLKDGAAMAVESIDGGKARKALELLQRICA